LGEGGAGNTVGGLLHGAKGGTGEKIFGSPVQKGKNLQ